ncbi:DJ-1/PfpI family protein [Candidatus Lokiarchaeum ossiferum]|uniref:DJ-1/PfpI family protein n=1 Tax=Candidatus Lokiarchaeum ossiferum TaxID=2951803 RepID=UPI00352C3103
MKTVLVFLYEGFAEFEITPVSMELNADNGYKITTIAYTLDPIVSSSGFQFLPHKLVSEIELSQNIAGVIIPGGSILDLRDDLKHLIMYCYEQKCFVAAICAGPQYLAACGLLDRHKYTTTRTHERYIELEQTDPFPWENYQEQRCVQDGTIITAKGYAYNDFALKIWSYLNIIVSEDEKKQWIDELNISI